MPAPAHPRPKVNATPTHADMEESARIEAALSETGATSAAGLRAAGKTAEANLADKQTGGVKDAGYSSAKFDGGVTSAKVSHGTGGNTRKADKASETKEETAHATGDK